MSDILNKIVRLAEEIHTEAGHTDSKDMKHAILHELLKLHNVQYLDRLTFDMVMASIELTMLLEAERVHRPDRIIFKTLLVKAQNELREVMD